MLRYLLNYLLGYVTIEINGFSVMRFINMAIHRKIPLWDIEEDTPGIIRAKILVKNFKELKYCIKKTKCKVRIIKKIGLPFFFHRYRKRKVLFLGALFFIGAIYTLSFFIWRIEIVGYDRISYDEISSFTKEHGLDLGTFKPAINRAELEKALLYNFSDIAYINVDIRGTRAIIHIAETLPPVEIIDTLTPSNIVATKEALIETISVSTGTPMVGPGDIVGPGDVLVSGQITSVDDMGMENAQYVPSNAKIEGRIFYSINFTVSKLYDVPNFTGEEKHQYSINIAGLTFNFFRNNNFYNFYENYDTITSRHQLNFGVDYPLPIILISHTTREYTYVTIERTPEEMEEKAIVMVTEFILRDLDFDVEILQKNIQTNKTEEGLDVEVLLITLENIGVIEYLEKGPANDQNTTPDRNPN